MITSSQACRLAMAALVLGLLGTSVPAVSSTNSDVNEVVVDRTITARDGAAETAPLAKPGQARLQAQTLDRHVIHLPLLQKPRDNPFELVADIGQATAFAVQGERAFVASGRSVLVVDVADPMSPQPVGRSPVLPGMVTDVAVDGDLLAVLVRVPPFEERVGLFLLLDISAGPDPLVVGRIENVQRVFAVDLSDGIAYLVGAEPGLRLVDVTDPVRPAPLGTGGDMAGVDVAVDGGVAYVVGWGSLTLFDVSTPTEPKVIPVLKDLVPTAFVKVMDGHLLVADQGDRARVYDLSRPDQPELIAEATLEGTARHMAIHSEHLYVRELAKEAPHAASIEVFRLGEAPVPERVGRFDLAAAPTAMIGGGHVVLEVVDMALLTQIGATVQSIDIADPATLRRMSTLFVGDIVLAVHAEGGRGYVDTLEGLEILDLRDPRFPRHLGRLPHAPYPGFYHADDMAVANEMLFVLGMSEHEDEGIVQVLSAFDVGDPGEPRRLDTWLTDEFYGRVDVDASRGVAVLSLGLNGGLTMIDVTSPSRMEVISRTELPFSTPSHAALNARTGQLYVVSSLFSGPTTRVAAVDVRDPARPEFLGSEAFEGDPLDLEVEGNHVYVTTDCGLHVFEATEGAPRLLGIEPGCTHETERGGQMLTFGDHVVIATPSGVLREVDVRDPAAPRQRASLRLPGEAVGLARSGRYVLGFGELPDASLMVARYER